MIIAVTGLAREARIISGPGIIVSRRGRHLGELTTQDAKGIISIGIAAGLDPQLQIGQCVIGSDVIADNEKIETDPAWTEALRARLGTARVGTIAGGDAIIGSASDKAALYARTHALAADMESHLAARASQEAKVPLAALRVISDGAGLTLPAAAQAAMQHDGSINLGAVLLSLLGKPNQIPALARTARDAQVAFGELLRCRRALGPGLACPYIG